MPGISQGNGNICQKVMMSAKYHDDADFSDMLKTFPVSQTLCVASFITIPYVVWEEYKGR